MKIGIEALIVQKCYNGRWMHLWSLILGRNWATKMHMGNWNVEYNCTCRADWVQHSVIWWILHWFLCVCFVNPDKRRASVTIPSPRGKKEPTPISTSTPFKKPAAPSKCIIILPISFILAKRLLVSSWCWRYASQHWPDIGLVLDVCWVATKKTLKSELMEVEWSIY